MKFYKIKKFDYRKALEYVTNTIKVMNSNSVELNNSIFVNQDNNKINY